MKPVFNLVDDFACKCKDTASQLIILMINYFAVSLLFYDEKIFKEWSVLTCACTRAPTGRMRVCSVNACRI